MYSSYLVLSLCLLVWVGGVAMVMWLMLGKATGPRADAPKVGQQGVGRSGFGG